MNIEIQLKGIPETRIEAVERALESTFGTSDVESAEQIAGGLSALVYRISVQGRPYVLRLILKVDTLNDPARQYACMNLAAQAGIAPRVYYADTRDALSITEYIETRPLSQAFASTDDLLRELVRTIQSIHSTPLFPALVNFMDGVDGFIQAFRASAMLPAAAPEECFDHYAQIQKAYPRHDTDLVSSHNDLNPNNILYDGRRRRIWIIDWEAAFRNDRYVDLANVANTFVASDEQEETYLRAYFGDSLDEYQRARFFLMRQVCHMFYSMVLLKLAAAAKPRDWAHDPSMATPSRPEFVGEIVSGTVSIASYEGQLRFGKVLLNEALRNMKTPRFAESISRMT